jgi:glycogen operon protein
VISDVNFLLLLNAGHESTPFALPTFKPETAWIVEFDTAQGDGLVHGSRHGSGQHYTLHPRSLVLLREDVRVRNSSTNKTETALCAPETAA